MRYAGIIKNDMSAAPGVAVSFFTQGCPHHCPGCHNPETWDFDGGKEFTATILDEIIIALGANGIERSFCVMGGEPLCEENSFLTHSVMAHVRKHYPDIKIYIWTGFKMEKFKHLDNHAKQALLLADYVIDGPYIEAERDITLPMRGSRNQRVIPIDNLDFL